MLTVDDHDVEPLARQPFRDQRAGDAGADDQRLAAQVFSDRRPRRMLRRGKPRRRAAAEIGLFGIVGIEGGDGWPRTRKMPSALTSAKRRSSD
jgi:hypothetical protein